ncbi:MAG: hypothetical protein K8S56_02455 [Candidatus Cloacimonetes bacterium]|nr:hypothetical protein [Candidatus Cloacimonadota bacterium]
MKIGFFMILILVLFFGCVEHSTVAPEVKPMVTIEILQNGVLQETYICTTDNNGDIYPVNINREQIGEI